MTKKQKNITWLLGVLVSVSALLTFFSQYDSPLAMDSDIQAVQEEIGEVRQLAEGNRMRMLWDDLKILQTKRAIAKIEKNQKMVIDLDGQILMKNAEIKYEMSKKKSTG